LLKDHERIIDELERRNRNLEYDLRFQQNQKSRLEQKIVGREGSAGSSSSSAGPSFGSGIELLMNDKKTTSSVKKSGIEIDDLTSLENDLNNLTDLGSGPSNHASAPLFSNITENKSSVKFADNINIGKATASETSADTKTWDGYGKFNNIPVNPDIKASDTNPSMSKEEMLKEKLKYLRKLEALEKKGVELTKKYSMESSLLEMQGEYEMIMEEKARQNSVKFQGNMMMAVINGIEFLNNNFVTKKMNLIKEKIPKDELFKSDYFNKFISSLILKDFFIYENEQDIYSKYVGYRSQNKTIIQIEFNVLFKSFYSF
jgi:hypothetical protein